MAVFETWLQSDLKKPVKVKQLQGNMFSADNGGNMIGVEVWDGRQAAELTGIVIGYIIRADGQTVVINGSLSGNRASITLPASAYVVVGQISIVIKVGTTTVGACTGYVYRSTTDTIVDPGSVIPSLAELLQKIADCEAATTAATAAATAAGYVNIDMSKTGNVITIVTTDKENQQTTETVTEPTATVTKSNGTVTVTITDADGTTTVSFTDPQGIIDSKADVINVEISTPSAVMTFADGADGQPMKLEVAIDPVQDLHGYDHPWPAGGGKNLNGMTLAECKEINTSGTWSNNVYTVDGVSFTVQTNSDGYITTITTSGSSEYAQPLRCGKCSLKNGVSYILSGCPSGGSSSKYEVMLTSAASGAASAKVHQYGSEALYTETEDAVRGVQIVIRAGQDATGLEFKPMVRLSTIADGTFEPYTNICHISGWTGAKVTRTGKNLFNKNGANFIKGYFDSEKFVVNNNQGTYYFKCVRGKTYTVSKIATSATGRMGIGCCHSIPPTNGMPVSQSTSKSSFSVGDRASLTITADDDYLLVWAYRKNNDEESIDTLQLEEGSAATAYEAYAGTEHQVTWQTEAGTVYSGTLTVNKDGSGVLVADTVKFLPSVSNMYPNTFGSDSGGSKCVFTLNDIRKGSANSLEAISNMSVQAYTYYHDNLSRFESLAQLNAAFAFSSSSAYVSVFVRKQLTQEQFFNEISGMEIVYPISTPVIYQLSAPVIRSLLGTNNVWADTGNINSVEYSADTKLYIDGKIADAIANILNA